MEKVRPWCGQTLDRGRLKNRTEQKGMRVNMNKAKVMISGERQMVRQKDVRWPCGICSKGVGSNSIQCSSCQKWVHKKCSGIKGKKSKGKVFPYSLPSVGPGADPGVQAVSPQVT